MKHKLTERITRHLAPPARIIAMLLLAVCAVGSAWATDSLEETGGVLSAVGTDTLAFKGVTLSELTADTLHGRMSGDWAGTAATKSFTFNNFDRSNEGSGYITCQAQMVDDGWLKGMVLKFTQSGDDINVKIVSAGAVNGGSIGGSVAGQTGSNSHYAIYNLFLTRTWSDSAVVIWEAGQFGVTSKTGSDGNTYTLNLNSNSNGSGEAITIDQSLGATIDFSSPFAAADGGSVLIRYSNLPLDTTQRAIVTTKCGNTNDRTGVWINTSATAGKTGGVWNGGNHNSSGNTRTTLDSNKSAGVMAFTYLHNGGTYLYYLAKGARTLQHGDSGLKGNNDTIRGIAIGGTRATSTTGTAATGMKITGIAIFKGVLTESQMKNFVWPSAVAAEYAKWNYAAAGRVVTWKSLPDASLDTGTGQKITVAGTTYGVFDTYSGSDTGTYTGGATSNSGAYWHYFCFGKSVYSAPGSVMRFVASNTYAHNIRADYSPLTIGGIIVESGATGYTIAEDASNARKDNRAVILGDQPASGRETWFRFNEDFTFGRQGALTFVGSVNIEVAAGKTMTITAKANNSSEAFVPKVCSSVDVNSDGSGALSTLTAGGTLRLHGLGKIVSTAGLDASSSTLDYTDLAMTVSSSSDAFIQGTVTVDSSTVIALPAGATFPYYIATGISGSLNSVTGVTIGGVAEPYYQAFADGYIQYVAPSEVTISADATWGSGVLDGWATVDATKNYIINVTADATLTLPSAVSTKTVKFNVDDGVTLTVSGSTITAEDEIEVTGDGIVKAGAANTFSGTIVGDGTLVYDNITPSGATFTDAAWEGVLWFKNGTRTSMDASALAGANSTLRLTGVTGYFNYGKTSNGALDLQDDGATKAFTLSDGWSDNNPTVFAKLTGSGTLAASNTGVSHRYVFKDPSAFSGTIDMSGKIFRIILGDNTSLSPAKDGTITIVSGATVNIAAGKTWTSDGGIEVDGTLNLGAGATVPKLKSGSDGMVVVVSGTATVTGIDSSAISPTLGIVGTLAFADTTTTELTLTAAKLSNSGTLDLSGCTAVTTMNLAFGNTRSGYLFGTITPPPNLASVNVTVTEVLSEDGVASLTIPASLTGASTLNVTVTGLDGTTKTVTKSVSGPVLSVSYTPTVSGAACWCAYEFETSDSTALKNTGSEANATGLTADGSFSAATSVDGDGKLYTYSHPYRSITYPTDGNWSAMVRCTVPKLAEALVVAFGTKSGGIIGLAAGENPDKEMRVVQGLSSDQNHYKTNGVMSVVNGTTAQHVYVFTVAANQHVKVYCDGTLINSVDFESAFNIGGGIQIGSIHGGIAYGLKRCWDGDTDYETLSEADQMAARIDSMRLYDCTLGANAIAALSEEFPAVKLYRATVAADATAAWDALTWSPAWDGGNEYSKIILTTEGDATLTLPDSITADEFTVNVASDSTLTLAKAGGGTTMTVSRLEIDDGTVAVADANFFDSRAINGTGTLKITGSGLLTSALSGNAKVEIPSGIAVGVTTGSIANPITGAGTLAYTAALPATAPTFSSWTGTVQLPTIATPVAIDFNNYGIAGSTVAITSMTAGWIANAEVLPEINLLGNMTLNNFSGNWVNTFDKLSGAGTFTLAADGTADGYVNNYFLVKDVSKFTGSISVAAPGLAIGSAKPSSPTTYGQILLTTSATVGAGAAWSANNGVAIGDANATLTVPTGATVPTPTTTVEGSYVKGTVDGNTTVYSVDAYNSVTFTAANATVTRTDELGTSIKDGDVITFTVTPASGYEVTGVTALSGTVTESEGVYSYTVTADATITVETREIVYAVTIGEATFEYSADYATAKTVTATVTGEVGDAAGTTWTLTVGGSSYTGTYTVGESDTTGTVTFSNVAVTAGDSFEYTIAAGGHAAGSTGSKSATAASVTGGWIDENSTNTNTDVAGGTWNPTITYTGTTATFAADSTNTFTATTQASGIVTLTTVINFGAAAAGITVDSDAKGAIRVAEESGNVFQLWTKDGNTAAWQTVSGATPNLESDSRVEITFDTAAQTYSVKVNSVSLSYNENVNFPFASAGDTIGAVTYIGAGTFTSLAGVYSTTNIMSSVDGANIVIPADFISDHLSGMTAAQAAAALAPDYDGDVKGANGLNYFTNYALRLDPTDADDKPIVSVTTDANGKFVVTVTHKDGSELTAATNVSMTPKFYKYTPGNMPGSGTYEATPFASGTGTIPPEDVVGEGNVGYIRAKIEINAK